MEVKKSGPINQTTEPNQSEPNQSEPTSDKLQTNRHRNVLLLSISISLYLCAYLRAYLCRLFACLCRRISA